MSEFRLTQISDTHLARRLPDADRKLSSGERIHRRQASRSRHQQRRSRLRCGRPAATISNLPERCTTRFPSPAATCPAITTSATTRPTVGPAPTAAGHRTGPADFLSLFGEDRWRFEAAGWCFIGLNSLVMNTGLASEAEQFDWLASQLAGTNGKPVALFLHKPLFLNSPDDPELPATSIRYVPMPARAA